MQTRLFMEEKGKMEGGEGGRQEVQGDWRERERGGNGGEREEEVVRRIQDQGSLWRGGKTERNISDKRR